ncbi:hypothetical protein GCM10025768_26500 [Microbacterium pseudoresistens]|uniref:Uncharacterized protein n=1 Tax=Microbacterium pseudoresistens TaxID=640634 RepID=A0A7Y9ETR2_9MICO|nr:hypothetical protein [Microbacterium pseudoresistens]NYD53763.1 hypothetical protein [Microbacterium pseudoresistens]
MARRIRVTSSRRGGVIREERTAPFWLEHLIGLIFGGLAVIVIGIVVLVLTDWGRVALTWIGFGFGVILTVVLFIAPVRSIRAGERTAVWMGEVLCAIGWGCMTISLAAGLPLLFWIGPQNLPEWAMVIPGAGTALFTGVAVLGMWLMTRGPLPPLDRTPRTATVLYNTVDAEGGQDITVRYHGADGSQHEAELADLIDDSWLDRFAEGTTWQIYAFEDAALADAVVFLTEEHDEVWRDGYKLNGVRLGGEGGPLPPGPGSPFLREGGKFTFE